MDARLSDFDVAFGQFMVKMAREHSRELFLAAGLASSQIGEGHICVDLQKYAERTVTLLGSGETYICPPFEHWRRVLTRSPVVGRPFEYKPLILYDNLLYLYRYWRYERSLVDLVLRRTKEEAIALDLERVRQKIDELMPPSGERPDWHRVAIFLAVARKLSFISGGPGTGKTYLTARIVALLHELAGSKPMSVAFTAPTGKAAARLQESIREARPYLPPIEIPTETFTLHRLLKIKPHRSQPFYSSLNPLPYNAVILDEASMVDLPLFSRLLQALRDDARLILLGDKDQLASVEPGAVFGELCGAAEKSGYSASFAQQCRLTTGQELPVTSQVGKLADSLVVLRKNFRFSPTSGIHQAAEAVNDGDSSRLLKILRQKGGEVEWENWENGKDLPLLLERFILPGYLPYLKATTIEEAFEHFNRFRVLCALKEGPFGVENVNRIIEYILARRGHLAPRRPWYEGMPIMITKNDYALMLMNGDCGLIMREEKKNRLAALFPDDVGSFRSFHPANLPAHEPVFAMTVHKSQGSEFDCVLLILPDRPSPVLTRELLYTAITRARKQIVIVGSEDTLIYALNRKTERASGLSKMLGEA